MKTDPFSDPDVVVRAEAQIRVFERPSSGTSLELIAEVKRLRIELENALSQVTDPTFRIEQRLATERFARRNG